MKEIVPFFERPHPTVGFFQNDGRHENPLPLPSPQSPLAPVMENAVDPVERRVDDLTLRLDGRGNRHADPAAPVLVLQHLAVVDGPCRKKRLETFTSVEKRKTRKTQAIRQHTALKLHGTDFEEPWLALQDGQQKRARADAKLAVCDGKVATDRMAARKEVEIPGRNAAGRRQTDRSSVEISHASRCDAPSNDDQLVDLLGVSEKKVARSDGTFKSQTKH